MTVEKRSTNDVVCEFRGWIEAVAGQQTRSENRKSWLARAAKRGGLTYRTVKSLYYGQIDNRSHPAAQQLRSAAQQYEIDNLISRAEDFVEELRRMRDRVQGAHQ